MLEQSPSIIYIESQRGRVTEQGGETFCSFNYGSFSNADKEPPYPVRYFNETVLDEGGKAALEVSGTCCFILPLYNRLDVIAASQRISLQPGESLYLNNHWEVCCLNPQPDEKASFLWFTFVQKDAFIEQPSSLHVSLPLNRVKNQWIHLPVSQIGIKIGCVESRVKLNWDPDRKAMGKTFLFNLAGSFEVCGRLLYEKDGLLLWDRDQIELEALHPASVIIMLELQDVLDAASGLTTPKPS